MRFAKPRINVLLWLGVFFLFHITLNQSMMSEEENKLEIIKTENSNLTNLPLEIAYKIFEFLNIKAMKNIYSMNHNYAYVTNQFYKRQLLHHSYQTENMGSDLIDPKYLSPELYPFIPVQLSKHFELALEKIQSQYDYRSPLTNQGKEIVQTLMLYDSLFTDLSLWNDENMNFFLTKLDKIQLMFTPFDHHFRLDEQTVISESQYSKRMFDLSQQAYVSPCNDIISFKAVRFPLLIFVSVQNHYYLRCTLIPNVIRHDVIDNLHVDRWRMYLGEIYDSTYYLLWYYKTNKFMVYVHGEEPKELDEVNMKVWPFFYLDVNKN